MEPCSETRRYIAHLAGDSRLGPPPPALVEHIAGCLVCRGALMLVIDALLGEQLGVDIDCARCELALPAYLEFEYDLGATAAMKTYPAVAQHLWTCSDCAELYLLTTATLVAVRTGHLAPPPLSPRRPTRILASFTLARAWLSIALPLPDAQLGLARSSADEPMVIFEAQEATYSISLTVQRTSAESWAVQAIVIPSADGWFLFGDPGGAQRVRLRAGLATIDAVPANLLEALSGPDLVGRIELDLPFPDDVRQRA